MKKKVDIDLLLSNILITLLIIRIFLPLVSSRLVEIPYIKFIGFVLVPSAMFFSFRYGMRNKKKNFLYNENKKLHLRNWLIFIISIVIIIVLVGLFYRPI